MISRRKMLKLFSAGTLGLLISSTGLKLASAQDQLVGVTPRPTYIKDGSKGTTKPKETWNVKVFGTYDFGGKANNQPLYTNYDFTGKNSYTVYAYNDSSKGNLKLAAYENKFWGSKLAVVTIPPRSSKTFTVNLDKSKSFYLYFSPPSNFHGTVS